MIIKNMKKNNCWSVVLLSIFSGISNNTLASTSIIFNGDLTVGDEQISEDRITYRSDGLLNNLTFTGTYTQNADAIDQFGFVVEAPGLGFTSSSYLNSLNVTIANGATVSTNQNVYVGSTTTLNVAGELAFTNLYSSDSQSSVVVSGVNGRLVDATLDGSGVITDSFSTNGGYMDLTLDNSASVNNDRVSNSMDFVVDYIQSKIKLVGNTLQDVSETLGELRVGNAKSTIHDFFYHPAKGIVEIEGNASHTTTMTFDSLTVGQSSVDSTDSWMSRVDFVATGAELGGNAKILFNTGPEMLANGMLKHATINATEFATYDVLDGVKAITTAKTSDVGFNQSALTNSDHLFVDTTTEINRNVSVNTLATNSDITTATGVESIHVDSGHVLIKQATVDARLDFGNAQGNILLTANTDGFVNSHGFARLNGGVSGTNGFILSDGDGLYASNFSDDTGLRHTSSLYLAASSTISGSVEVYDSNLILEADDALMGADVNIWGRLDLGATTQHFDSLVSRVTNPTQYSDITERGSIYADGATVFANNINLWGAFKGNLYSTGNLTAGTVEGDVSGINVNVGGVTGNVTGTNVNATYVNGNIDASSTVNVRGVSGGIISGAADVSVNGGSLSGANTYTGKTNALNMSLGESASILSSAHIFIGDNDVTTNGAKLLINSGIANTDHIGNATQVSFVENGGLLNFSDSGQVVDISEDVGAIDVADNVEAFISLQNEIGGSTRLQSDSLQLGNDSLLFVNLGDNGSLFFDAGLATSVEGVVDGIYMADQINAYSSTASLGTGDVTWATYNATSGLGKVAITETSLDSAVPGAHIKATGGSSYNGNYNQAGVQLGANVTVAGTGSLNLGSSGLIMGNASRLSIAAVDFDSNPGLIFANGAAQIDSDLSGTNGLRTNGSVWLNGDVDISGNSQVGGSLVIAGNWLNADITGGSIKAMGQFSGNLNQSNLDVAGTGVATFNAGNQVNGTIDNTGIVVNHGVVNGAVTNNSLGNFTNNGTANINLVNSGNFVNSTTGQINGSVDLRAGSAFTNEGSVSVGSSSFGTFKINKNVNFVNDGNITINSKGTLRVDEDYLDTSVALTNNGVIELNSGATLIRSAAHTGNVVNNGDFIVKEGASYINDYPASTGSYVQNSGRTVVNGIMAEDIFINDGTFGGSGTVVGNLVIGPNGTLIPGNSPGTLTVEGDLFLDESASLILEIDGTATGEYDRLLVGGSFDLFGGIVFDLGAGFDEMLFADSNSGFSLADMFLDLSENSLDLSLLIGSDMRINLDGGNSFLLDLADDGNGGYLTTSTAVVPVPAAIWLFGSGLIGLVGFARRKKA